jgi:hypothetical protein
MSFAEKLKVGMLGEDAISRWLISRGHQVLPAYQIQANHGKGPRLFGAYGQLISPDLFVFKDKKAMWVEAKHKTSFTWHRITQTWQTGIDKRHWSDYLQVERVTPFPVWLVFLHKPGENAKDTPAGMVSPTGLFANSVEVLKDSIDHEHENHGPSGMVYWREKTLIKLAESI